MDPGAGGRDIEKKEKERNGREIHGTCLMYQSRTSLASAVANSGAICVSVDGERARETSLSLKTDGGEELIPPLACLGTGN